MLWIDDFIIQSVLKIENRISNILLNYEVSSVVLMYKVTM